MISFAAHLIWQEGVVVLPGACAKQRDRGRGARRGGRRPHPGPDCGHGHFMLGIGEMDSLF